MLKQEGDDFLDAALVYGIVGDQDHIGPFARSVKEAAILLSVIAGRDLRDATSAEAPVPDYSAQLDGNVKGLKLGLPREYIKDLTGESHDLPRKAAIRMMAKTTRAMYPG